MSRIVSNLIAFGGVLRGAGLAVNPGRLLDVIDALAHVDLAVRDDVYYTCRALLVHRQEELAVFDRAFDAFWRVHGEGAIAPMSGHENRDAAAVDVVQAAVSEPILSADPDAADDDAAAEPNLKTWSDRPSFASKDFASLTPAEMDEARALLARLTWTPGERRTRRWVHGRGRRLDLRRAIAGSLRTGGEIVRLEHRRRRTRPRPLILLCDVSGSMERYSRMLLQFAHAIARRHHRVEAFLFSTALTRVTRQLRMPNADAALAAVARTTAGWSGGTRIGEAIHDFHRRWGRRTLHGGPVVLLISDGWDRGDPTALRDQIARLQRGCHRLIWLNPLIGTADYAPLTRGLQAALPFVDDFLPARTLTNLSDLAAYLNALE